MVQTRTAVRFVVVDVDSAEKTTVRIVADIDWAAQTRTAIRPVVDLVLLQ